MIGAFIYIDLAAAAICLLVGAKKRKRWASTTGVLLFACALGALAEVHARKQSYWLAVMYVAAAASQVYAAFRTWRRWPPR